MVNTVGKSELKVEYSSREITVPKNLEYEYVIYERELEYTFIYSKISFLRYLRSLHDAIWWNTIMGVSVLSAIVMVMVEDYQKPQQHLYIVDAVFNLLYAIHVVGVAIIIYTGRSRVTMLEMVAFLVDALTFTHYLVTRMRTMRLIVYCVRLHRPLQYQWSNNNYNVKSSIWGSAFKITYLNFVLRIGWTVVWIYVHEMKNLKNTVYSVNKTVTTTTPAYTDSESSEWDSSDSYDSEDSENSTNITEVPGPLLADIEPFSMLYSMLDNYTMSDFTALYYQINRMYIPVGTSMDLSNDVARLLCVLVQISGCLMLAGAAIATLSLVFSIFLAPEEAFRARYRLIIKEMIDSRVRPALKEKVETFYMIYWKKHNAVSSAALMPILPQSLTTAINFDIYFEATQKSRMLKDTPNYFLSEVMKNMTTTHYIPGDTIIGRGSNKHSMYYITYGDIEMLTAEDDNTAVLRMTRGTVLTPCSPSVVVASVQSHVEIRAATFCTAQVLNCPTLWKTTLGPSKHKGRTAYLLWAFREHLEKVKIHYSQRFHPRVLHLSSIKAFKYGLLALKKARDSDGKLLMPRKDVFLEIAGCYITRSDIESTQTDESDAICLRQQFPCILQASSSLLDVWHSFVTILTTIVVITHPYHVAFAKEKSNKFYAFDHVVSIVYVIDLIVFLSTGTNIEEGMVITLSNTAMYQIRQSRFVVDVLATLPIFKFVYDGRFNGINKLLKIPQLFHSLKNVEDNCVYHSHVLRFCTFTLLVVMICYLIAFVQQVTMCFGFNLCELRNFTHPPYWINRPLGDDVTGRVTFYLYWAVSIFTLTSHMVVYVKNSLIENLITIVHLEVVLFVRIIIEASYSATIMVTSAMRQNFDSFISSVKDFLVRKEIDPVLRHRFITYLELCWYTDNAFAITHEKRNIFYDLPPHVYEDIVAKQRSTYLLCVPFIKLLHKVELRAIASKARLFYTSPNEILLNTGDFSDEIFVIKQGICEMLCPVQRKSVGFLKPKSHFGSLECLLKFPAYYTFRAVTHVQIISVKRRLFYRRCCDIPQIKNAIEFTKSQPEFAKLQQHTYRSFVTYQYPEKPPNRQIFKQRRKFEKDYEFLVPFEQLGFLSVLRYVFPRFTIRPDSKYLELYEWFRAFCALLASLVFPSYEYLVLHLPGITNLARILDLTAYFDMVQRTIIGYYDEKGILIYHPSSTLAHYLRGAFIVDLVACVPLENLQPLSSIGDHYRVDMLRQGLMLNRLLQLYRFFQTIEALHVYLRQDIMLVLKSLPLFVTLVNVMTVFIVLSSATIEFPKAISISNDSYRITPLKDPGGSWIDLFSGVYRFNMTENVINYHLAVYFWVVYETTSTGFGIIKPTNHRIMTVLFVGMVIGSMITMYFSVRVISVRSNINVALCSFQEHKKDIQNFMMKENLNEPLRKLVRNYYDFNWDNMGGVETRSLLKLCDQVSLRTDCILHIYGPTFQECPILPHTDISLMRVISRCMRDVYFVKKMDIMITDDVIRDMYFVNEGTIHIRIVGKSVCKIVKLNRGCVFGNFERTPIRSPATAVAKTNVQLLQIKSRMFHNITKGCPTVFDLIAKHRPHKEMYICTQSKDTRSKRRNKRKTISTINVTEAVQTKFRTEDVRLAAVLALITYCSMCGEVYNMCYQVNSRTIIPILYSLDLLFCFKIAFLVLVPNSKDSQKFRAMRMKYIKSEFAFDVISCIPLELFAFLNGSSDRWLWFSWLRIGRMFRLITLYKCLRRKHKKLSTNLAASTVLTVAVWFSFSIHVIACAFYYIGTLEDYASPKSSWKYSSTGKSLCNNEYVCTIYFIMTTFTHNGVGDIMPGKHLEVIIVATLEIISTMMYMVYVGEFSNIIQYESYRAFTFYSEFLQLKNYLQNNSVSDHLIDVIRQYCLHLWRESRGLQMPYFLTYAPPPLKLQVMTAAYLHHLDRHPVFRHCEKAFLRQLTGCLKLFSYNEGLMIVKENEITDSMYFIHQGTVQESSDKEGVLRIYVTREYFGEFQGLNRNEPFQYSYQSIYKSQILMLHLNDWEYLLEHFPKSRAAIYGGPIPKDPSVEDYDPDIEITTDPSAPKYDTMPFASSELIQDYSSLFSVNSKIKAVPSAESAESTESPQPSTSSRSRPSQMLRFTANKDEEAVKPISSLRPNTRQSVDQGRIRRISLKFPFVQLKSVDLKTVVDDDDDSSIDMLKLFTGEAPPPLFPNLPDDSAGIKNTNITPQTSDQIIGERPTELSSKEKISPEVPVNRQLIYMHDETDEKALKSKSASKLNLIDDNEIKPTDESNLDEKETDEEIQVYIENIMEKYVNDFFDKINSQQTFENVNSNQKGDEVNDDQEKFEVFIQGKAFGKSENLKNNQIKSEGQNTKVVQEKSLSIVEQNKDNDMVQLFVDNAGITITDNNDEENEVNENARIKAFAASQATLDARKRLYEPDIRSPNTQKLRRNASMKVPPTNNRQEKENDKALDQSLRVQKNSKLSEDNKLAKTIMNNDENEQNYKNEKFEVFLQGNAFKKADKGEKNEDTEAGTSGTKDNSKELEDKGEFLDVLVQGKAFEKNKDHKNKDDEKSS